MILFMAIIIEPTQRGDVGRIACPECGEKVKYVAIEKDSNISGLTFRCRRCGRFFSVRTTK